MQRTGIGPALRKARLVRGKSIEEASRETRIRGEYLDALERETFDTFLGDVYVRGFLRSYSSYLGLDADKVLVAYNRHFGPPKPTLPDPLPGPVRSEKSAHPQWFPFRGHHPTWAFTAVVAILAIAALAAAGLFHARSSPTSELPPSVPPTPTAAAHVIVALVAVHDVHGSVASDGRIVWRGVLRAGEQRSFQGTGQIKVQLDQGGFAKVTVNGHSLGAPGSSAAPYTATFGPNDYRRSPSPSTSTHPSSVAAPAPTARVAETES